MFAVSASIPDTSILSRPSWKSEIVSRVAGVDRPADDAFADVVDAIDKSIGEIVEIAHDAAQRKDISIRNVSGSAVTPRSIPHCAALFMRKVAFDRPPALEAIAKRHGLTSTELRLQP
jgi:hypothetical protein